MLAVPSLSSFIAIVFCRFKWHNFMLQRSIGEFGCHWGQLKLFPQLSALLLPFTLVWFSFHWSKSAQGPTNCTALLSSHLKLIHLYSIHRATKFIRGRETLPLLHKTSKVIRLLLSFSVTIAIGWGVWCKHCNYHVSGDVLAWPWRDVRGEIGWFWQFVVTLKTLFRCGSTIIWAGIWEMFDCYYLSSPHSDELQQNAMNVRQWNELNGCRPVTTAPSQFDTMIGR